MQAFLVLWRAQQSVDGVDIKAGFPYTILGYTLPSVVFYKWFVLSATWFAVGFIVMLGPAIGSGTEHGDFCMSSVLLL